MSDIVLVYNHWRWTNVSLGSTDIISGWVQVLNVRGSWELLWSNIFTVFICAWTVLNLNLPEPDAPPRRLFWRRIFMMIHAVSGPEFILAYAAGQRQSAQLSAQVYKRLFPEECQSSTEKPDSSSKLRSCFSYWHRDISLPWQQEHGFFADMGGIWLELDDHVKLPVNWRHIFWLKQNNLINWRASDLPVANIKDQSKQDSLLKVITALQVGYRILDSIGRWAQGLYMSTLELSTLASVVIAILTTILWLPKPADVRTPHYIRANAGVTLAYLEAFRRTTSKGTSEPAWRDTPLDFVDDLRPSWALTLRNRLEDSNHKDLGRLWELMGGPLMKQQNTPLQRFPDDRLPHAFENYYHGISAMCLLALAMLIYPGILVAGWNFWFPTRAELLLWRISSLFILCATAGIWLTVTAFWLHKFLKKRKHEERDRHIEQARQSWTGLAMDPALNLHDRVLFAQNESGVEFAAIVVLALGYSVARWYQVVGVFVELRSLPSSAFRQVDWSNFLPHF